MVILNISEYKKIMGDPKLDLPKRWDGKNFDNTLEEEYDYYLKKIKPIININDFSIIKNKICNKLVETIKDYFSGYPSKALNRFSNIMKTLNQNYLTVYQKSGTEAFMGKDPLKLFKVRVVPNNGIYYRNDIFHTPYNLRSKVSSCRYSIAGYPSLYLATSLQLCDEEVKIRDLSEFKIASRFQLERDYNNNGNIDIKVIELAIKPSDFIYPESYKNYSEYNLKDKNRRARYFNEIYLLDDNIMRNYLFWYPLTLACSFIRFNKMDNFSAEYIIPQLLMQWLRKQYNENQLYGIRYFSCSSVKASEMGFNYVFPASGKRINNTEFCNILSKSFKLTNPRFLHEFSNINDCENALLWDNVDYIIK